MYRARAHTNPFNDSSLERPDGPDHINWCDLLLPLLCTFPWHAAHCCLQTSAVIHTCLITVLLLLLLLAWDLDA